MNPFAPALSRSLGLKGTLSQPVADSVALELAPRPVSEANVAVKVRASLAALKQKPGSSVVRRHGATVVINKTNPKWKARQG